MYSIQQLKRALNSDPETIPKACENMILSVSGWRKLFTEDQKAHSMQPHLSVTDQNLTIMVSAVFAQFLQNKTKKEAPSLLLGRDSRPTGKAMASLSIQTFLAFGIKVKYLDIVCAPEIMAATALSKTSDGFYYISASHNPPGYNGFKLGLSDGGVLSAKKSIELREHFLKLIKSPQQMNLILKKLELFDRKNLKICLDKSKSSKKQSEKYYKQLITRTISGFQDDNINDKWLSTITQSIQTKPISILADYNGSARCTTIDSQLLSEMGIGFKAINATAGHIIHEILPEGDSLIPCMKALEKEWKQNPAFCLGFVPDNDGDRGNLVFIDENTGKAHPLEAQQVFALTVLSELAWVNFTQMQNPSGEAGTHKKQAVVVNGATSLRIDAICESFNCHLFRSEVGEANVTRLADDLRKSDYLVRILGEGSNGGNITWPAKVRDPLNTLFSFVKLLTIKGSQKKQGLFATWLNFSQQNTNNNPGFSLLEVISSLPPFITTRSFDERAKLKIKSKNQLLLKEEYEQILQNHWNDNQGQFKKEFGIYSWQIINYEGTDEIIGLGKSHRSGAQDGGFKVLFKGKNGTPKSFIWMRGSRTEPIFRLLADVEGTDALQEKTLMDWHRKTIIKADQLAFQRATAK